MANLKAGTLIGGNLIWNAGNMPLRTLDRRLFINEDEVYTTFKKPTPAEVGAVNKAGDTMTGALTVNHEIKSKTSNSYWMSDGSIGTFWRKDGTDLYLMRTADGQTASSGTWSTHRPFAVNLATCKVSIGNGLYVRGGLELGDDITLSNKYVKGTNNAIIMRDHGNGNVTLSAGLNSSGQPGDLYLGYTATASGTAGYNTRKVLLRAPMDWEAKHNLINGEGKINSEQFTGPIRTEKGDDNVYHTIIGGTDTVNRGRVIIAAGESGKKIYDNTSSGEETVHIGGDGNAAIWLHTGLQNAWGDATHKRVKVDQGELYAVDGTFKVFHHGYKPFRVHTIQKPSGVVDGRYYPIVITNMEHNQQLYISTRSSGGSDPMNNCSFDGIVRSGGWNDATSYVEGLFTAYTASERAIHSIVGPTENAAGYVVYVEARAFPLTVRVDAGCTVSVQTTDVSYGTSIFKAGVTAAQITSGDFGTKVRNLQDFDLGTGYYRYDRKVNDKSQILKGTINFDNYVVGGTYNIYNPASDSVNPPPFAYGTMFVIGRGGSEVANCFVTQYATDKITRKTYVRTRNDTNWTWTSWVQLYDSGNKPTPADIGAVNKAGDTMTGRLTSTGFTSSTAGNAFISGTTADGSQAVISAERSYVMLWKKNNSATIADEFIGIQGNNLIFRQDNKTGDKKYTDNKVYHTKNKPTASELGVLPITGGRLTGILYAKTGIISESPDGKNWVGLEAADGTAKPYISVRIDGTSRKVIDFNSPTESTFLTGVATQQNFTCTKGSAGGFYLNNVSDGSKYKWGVLKGNANEFSIANWTDTGGWNKNVIEIDKDATKTTVNTSLAVKNTVCEIGFADNTNLHLWFRKANGTERSLIWSDEEQIRIRHKEGNWLGIKQNGSVHTSANPPQMNEGVYNGTTVGGVWRRGQGVFHAKVAHQGSSWAPMFSAYFHDTEGYDGFYTFGHLSSAGAGVGTYCLQFMDGAGNANKNWSFNGSNGDFVSPGNVVAYSDIRVKTKIEKIENALDKIDQITGVTYDRTDVVTSRQMGVIAQDVEKVAPEVVTRTQHGELGEILGVSYGNLVGLLIEGIKELRGELAELKTQMNK